MSDSSFNSGKIVSDDGQTRKKLKKTKRKETQKFKRKCTIDESNQSVVKAPKVCGTVGNSSETFKKKKKPWARHSDELIEQHCQSDLGTRRVKQILTKQQSQPEIPPGKQIQRHVTKKLDGGYDEDNPMLGQINHGISGGSSDPFSHKSSQAVKQKRHENRYILFIG